ncbi:hypothetical protein G7074_00155 [Pedobacter sp. HDW13]|uniref:hypothetical protein n=1 Tax=unclassified Pedobacter TaxID=2628915 RepID=UPI000F5AE4D3|nr:MULTISPECIES: hypothetical protein [unclassified Pedobacter]QIL37839.1 hypothetical protein G7074_00155 [Pedobacter sp. HDW13]RQO78998.1 hypothetical protein DBR40_04540 [Pedobacter sp. KBW01]
MFSKKVFKPEELIFGGIAISSLIVETKSVVPALVSCYLLAFYYFVFCWYLFAVKNEKRIFRSISFGILHALIWFIIGSCSIKMFGELDWFFYLIEAILLLTMGLYLFLSRKKNSNVFTSANCCRISIIICINIFILIFK